MEVLKRTPLYDFHQQHGARFVEFAGWEMPVQYTTGILNEHRAVRTISGLFDVCHMGEIEISGPDAASMLDYALTNEIANMSQDKAVYAFLCNENGGVEDDLIVYKTENQRYLLCVNAANTAKDFKLLQQRAEGFDCQVEDCSDQYGQLAIQGPMVEMSMMLLLNIDYRALQPFRHRAIKIGDVPVRISATGYTGERGFELFCAMDKVAGLGEKIYRTGQLQGLKLCGLGARDSLRLEAGYPLHGHEISETISPLEAGMGFAVKLKKEANFVGKTALAEQKARGLKRKIIHFKLEDKRIARAGSPILSKGEQTGVVTSGTMSPTLGYPIGAALIELDKADLEDLQVDIRGHAIKLTPVKPPFIK